MAWLILGAIGVTSALAIAVGVVALEMSQADLRRALGKLLECVGLSVCFAALNIAVTTMVVIAVRSAGAGFVSAYVIVDPILLVLSALQAITFQWWREAKSL